MTDIGPRFYRLCVKFLFAAAAIYVWAMLTGAGT